MTEQIINNRIQSLRTLMKERCIDAYLIPTADFHESEYVGEYFKCRQFMTGFSGTAGTAVITETKAGLWTDGRYFVQAEKQLSGTCVTLYRMGDDGVPTVEEFLKEQLPQSGRLGFDGRVVGDEMGSNLANLLDGKEISFSYEEDLVGMIWEDRPPMSKEPLWILEECYAGKSASEKIGELREVMRERNADVHILTALDEIAWLLNLRGNDIPCNPIFLSCGAITEDDFFLFVQDGVTDATVCSYLEDNGVTVCPYEKMYEYARSLKNQKVLLERKKVNYAICEGLDSSNRIIDAMNPCVLKKAIKNKTEIENMKKVHIKDGVAVTKFMYWLKHHIGTEPMTEMTVVNRLEAMRKELTGYLGPSFTTIAAYHDNAAMCHYHPSNQECRELKPEGLLLLDSGGQYYEGTTDITRTFALGPLTEKEKEYFTLVSMSMLKAGEMKFLHGCRGLNLDYTIREAFWQRGLDFNHGTGHGVGYLSGVHERPNGIRWKIVPERQDSAILEPGMICSDEPGLYFEGEFGVRTENLILCVADEKNKYGQFLRFEFLTFAPIDLEAIDTDFMDEHDLRRLNHYHKEVYAKISPYLTAEEAEWLKHATREISGKRK
ncbi:MAG: aminopeptidase P family N-terminal domain-containing protein [Clostridium sp.]